MKDLCDATILTSHMRRRFDRIKHKKRATTRNIEAYTLIF